MRTPGRIRGAALIQGGEKCLVALRAAIQFVGLQRLHRPPITPMLTCNVQLAFSQDGLNISIFAGKRGQITSVNNAILIQYYDLI